jgi:carbon monoxide dehydrogenase subunit G
VEFTHHALIGASPGQVFEFLSDVEHVAACLPGARVTGHLGNNRYAGIVRVKMTAVQVTLSGDLEWLPDLARREITLVGKGRDSRRGSTASGRIVVSLKESTGGGTCLTFQSHIDVAGRLAQLGRGIIAAIAARIIGDFVLRVEASLTSQSVPPAPEYLDVGSATADEIRERAGRFFRAFTRGRS